MPGQSYLDSTAISSRRRTGRRTSNAFSGSVNSDEDWTKVSDLVERRRIQNRIAQRNYRKKLKSRLEDLERRVGSSSASPPQMEELHHQQDLKKSVQTYERNSEIIHRQPSPTVLQSHRSNPMEISLIVGDPFEREESGTHPSHRQQPYRPVSTGGSQFGDLLIPFSASVPPAMCFYGAVEQEDETISQFNMCLSDIGHASHGYDLNPHASSISQSYNHSSNYSESGYEYHTTPGDASFS